MTTWENIDSVNPENVVVTSDEAYERVTNDIKMEELWSEWYLKQNTSWLVQEIPNISFLDIADTMLESKKTFYKRENWVLRVWVNGKSVEAQPQDTVRMFLTANQSLWSWWDTVSFDDDISSLNNTVCKVASNKYEIEILQTWYYRISYWWTINPWTCTDIYVLVRNSWSASPITWEEYSWWSYWTKMSWWRTIWSVYLQQWEKVYFIILWTWWNITAYKDYTYLELQFQQYTLWNP